MDNKYRRVVWLVLTAVLTFIFIYIAAANLPDYYPVSADDSWIMSASYKLSSQGVLGSDMYAGFYNADRYYFIALPVYHFLQAASYKLIGVGIAQARLPNVFSAVALIWVMSSLGNRYYGRKGALLTAVLLVFWRSNLLGFNVRVPLLALAHSGRYDIIAAALVWTAVWLLDTLIRQPRRLTALALGVVGGLATLTQFFGVFILLPILLTIPRQGKFTIRRDRLRLPNILLVGLGFGLVLLPYLFYVLAHFDAFEGQSVLKNGRIQFLQPMFYLDNVLREPGRFASLIQQSAAVGSGSLFRLVAPWLLVGLAVAAVYFAAVRIWRRRGQGWPLPFLSLLCFGAALALFEQTKAPVYAVLLLPGICLALAALVAAVLDKIGAVRPIPLRVSLTALIMILLTLLVWDGAESHLAQLREARQAHSFVAVGKQIEASLTPEATILGSERWWPALARHPYLALNNLWMQWKIAVEKGESPDFAEQARLVSADFLIVDIYARDALASSPTRLQEQFRAYLATCATIVADWTDLHYARIQVYRLDC